MPTIASEQANDVFKDQPLGPYFLGYAADLPEKAGPGTGEAGACTHARHVLAREPADEHVDGAEVVGADFAHVGELSGVRKPQCERLAQVRLDCDLPGGPVSGLLESKGCVALS
ncbi:hypothetical protein NBM50_00175 [Xylophilus ampelinus]|uniref:Uncharacterized protein n=1 Tax=Xylophilus ampelinus TaxID=54067 RepID=A0A318SDW0_9BURK|nr:hypothetical protein [Xylophilus ampelinus]MCS4508691.1 hypothetical protein [Xylophilus ampelinus]PYE74294.1 hypothetical protein DFQ15_12613 [Xylophilus ampelinus]